MSIKSIRVWPLFRQAPFSSDPQICGGRPCIRHMRIRVKDILDLLASGASTAEILQDYPYLEADDIKAALEYAAHQVDHPILSVA
jgi:uncharacterized protein (DUF433 family)